MKDLSTRDFVSRCISKEISEGRGCGPGGDYVMLDGTNIPSDVVSSSLPGVKDVLQKLKGIDIGKDLIPVLPTAHYSMGGIPTDLSTNVLDKNGIPVEGLIAIGEAACVSVHGANRLGSNSLLELVVFGAVGAKRSVELAKRSNNADLKVYSWQYEGVVQKVDKILFSSGESRVSDVRSEMQSLMEDKCGIVRDESGLEECIVRLGEMVKRVDGDLGISNRGMCWNDNLTEALELQNLLTCSLASARSALARRESRGSHFRSDFPLQKDDFKKHTIATMDGNVDFEIKYDPVRVLGS